MSSFDRDFGSRFDPVEETVVFDEGALQLLERRPVGNPEFVEEYRIQVTDAKGEEWEYLVLHEISIGRADDNHIPLDDRAISRHHLAINTDGKFYWFRDLDSGNGTQLNGEYAKEGWLTGGEVLTIGNSTVLFLAPNNLQPKSPVLEEPEEEIPEQAEDEIVAAEAVEALEEEQKLAPILQAPVTDPETGSNKIILLAFIFVLAFGIAGMGGWLVYRSMNSGNKGQNKEDNSAKLQRAISLFSKGKKLKRQRKWKSSELAFRQASALLPIGNALREEISEAIKEIKDIRKNNLWYRKAKKLYFNDEEKVIEVLQLLSKIDRNSSAFKRAEKLRLRLLKPLFSEARTFARVGKMTEAKQILAKMKKYAGQHPQVIKLQQYIRSQEEKAKPAPPPPPPRRRSARRRYKRPTRRPPSELSTAITMYGQGRYDSAIIFLRRKEAGGDRNTRRWAKRLRQSVEIYKQNFRAGQFASGRGQLDRAISLLGKAARADKVLNSKRRASVGRVFARALSSRGSRNLSRKRYVPAYRDFKRALSFNRYAPSAKQGIRRLQQKAQRLYDEAMTVKDLDNDGAKRLFMKVIKILPRNHPLSRRAKSQLR